MPPSTCVRILCSLSFLYFSNGASPDPLLPNFAKHSGYGRIGDKRWMYYYFFEERSALNRPVILWLTGVPGLSSTVALFYENGPFRITDDLTLIWSEYGWDKHANILYVDEPVGTGFSHKSSYAHVIREYEYQIVNDLYAFLKWFFAEYSKFKDREFFIIGQSYAGKYAPMLASRIYKDIETKAENTINIKGVALGNAFTRPKTQYGTLLDFYEKMFVVNYENLKNWQSLSEICQNSTSSCEQFKGSQFKKDDCCLKAYEDCDNLLQSITHNAGGSINIYDVNKPKITLLNYDFSKVELFLNDKSVKEALGVGLENFITYDRTVYNAFKKDYMKSAADDVTFLLEEGIQVLVYVGDYDLFSNHIGNLKWVEELNWSGSSYFNQSTSEPLLVKNVASGELRGYKNLVFIKVFKAGHMVAMDQPKVAFDMVERWLEYALKPLDG